MSIQRVRDQSPRHIRRFILKTIVFGILICLEFGEPVLEIFADLNSKAILNIIYASNASNLFDQTSNASNQSDLIALQGKSMYDGPTPRLCCQNLHQQCSSEIERTLVDQVEDGNECRSWNGCTESWDWTINCGLDEGENDRGILARKGNVYAGSSSSSYSNNHSRKCAFGQRNSKILKKRVKKADNFSCNMKMQKPSCRSMDKAAMYAARVLERRITT